MTMKSVVYAAAARDNLVRYAGKAAAIMAKVKTYATTGAGDVKVLKNGDGTKRLRVGDFRVIFVETDTRIVVVAIGPRNTIYD